MTGPALDGLTKPQRDAVTHTEGPLLVLAGPGSGKTRVITMRIAHLISLGVPPWSILAVTFTNKAAAEMRERVLRQILGADASDEESRSDRRTRGLTITTFHSLCARLLRRYAEQAQIPGLKPDYTIYDAADQAAAMKKVLKEMDLSSSNWPPRSVLSAISNAKNELLDAEAFAANAGDYYSTQLSKIYTRYSAALRQLVGELLARDPKKRPARARPPGTCSDVQGSNSDAWSAFLTMRTLRPPPCCCLKLACTDDSFARLLKAQ